MRRLQLFPGCPKRETAFRTLLPLLSFISTSFKRLKEEYYLRIFFYGYFFNGRRDARRSFILYRLTHSSRSSHGAIDFDNLSFCHGPSAPVVG